MMAKEGNIQLDSIDWQIANCSILEIKEGGYAIEWFRGRFLPTSHDNEFLNYCSRKSQPLDCLINKARFEKVYPVLKECLQNPQQDLFDTLEHSLDELVSLGNILYKQWKQPKTSNHGLRNIAVPKQALKNLLVNYVLPFIKKAPMHYCAHGGEPRWAPERSLTTHLPIKNVLSFDLQDAFDNLSMLYIFDFFYDRIKATMKGVGDKEALVDAAGFLSNLCSVRETRNTQSKPSSHLSVEGKGFVISLDSTSDNVLPQGSPISTALFNRIMYPVDKLFYKLARKNNMNYSRWVDDFILSSSEHKSAESFLRFLGLINNDFKILPEKIFYQKNPCYLLGHKIEGRDIIKMSKEEGEKIRGGHIQGISAIADYNKHVEEWWMNQMIATAKDEPF